jgi:hypothetical protein
MRGFCSFKRYPGYFVTLLPNNYETLACLDLLASQLQTEHCPVLSRLRWQGFATEPLIKSRLFLWPSKALKKKNLRIFHFSSVILHLSLEEEEPIEFS